MDIDLTGRDTQVIICSQCNCQFIFRPSEQTYSRGKPSLCPSCYRKKRDEQNKEKEKLAAERRKREKELERIQFDERLKITFSYPVNYATFLLSDEYLFVILRGPCPGIFFFHMIDEHWSFMRELEHIPYQSVLNRRLVRVIQNNEQLIFVYNNRIRKYSLSDGTLIANQALRNARSRRYDGIDVSDRFIQGK